MRRSFTSISKFAGQALGAREIIVRASDEGLDRQGDVLVPKGCDHRNYDANPIVLADHDPKQPIGNASIEIKHTGLELC